MALNEVSHRDIALSRLPEQFKRRPNFEKLAKGFGDIAQGVENVLRDIYLLYRLDSAAGAQLDVIGRLVGQPRDGVSDTTYRNRIKARIRVNKTRGMSEDIYAVFRTLGIDEMELEDQFPAGFVLRIFEPILAGDAAEFAKFLADAKAAGVRGLLEWQEDVAGEMFTMACQTYLTVLAPTGATEITVKGVAGFPASDRDIALRDPAGTFEVYHYAQAATLGGPVYKFQGLTPPLSNNFTWSVDTPVTLYPFAGKGLDDTTSPGGGGKFASVSEGT
jgi:hypothetical protein